MLTIGAKEFRKRLSYYLKEAEAGRRVVITLRGKPVAQLISMPKLPSIDERLKALVEAGRIHWGGERPKFHPPVTTNKGERQISDIVIEDRR